MGRSRELFDKVTAAREELDRALIEFADDGGHFYRVLFFMSARLSRQSKAYEKAERAMATYARYGCDGMTGGGPGGMEAGNSGIKRTQKKNAGKSAKPRSCACSLTLPHETESNPFLDIDHRVGNFALRLEIFRARATCYVIGSDGGIGTGYEGFDALQHMQIFLKALITKSLDKTCATLYPLHPSVRMGFLPPIIFVGPLWKHIKRLIDDFDELGYAKWDEIPNVHFVDNYKDSYRIVRRSIKSWRKFLLNREVQPAN